MTTEKVSKPPPAKMFNRPRNWLFWKNVFRATRSTPGIGMVAATRKTTNSPRTYRIFCRTSLIFQTSLILSHMGLFGFAWLFGGQGNRGAAGGGDGRASAGRKGL